MGIGETVAVLVEEQEGLLECNHLLARKPFHANFAAATLTATPQEECQEETEERRGRKAGEQASKQVTGARTNIREEAKEGSRVEVSYHGEKRVNKDDPTVLGDRDTHWAVHFVEKLGALMVSFPDHFLCFPRAFAQDSGHDLTSDIFTTQSRKNKKHI